MYIFDTHAHLNDARFSDDRDYLIKSLPERGIGVFCEIGYDLESSKEALALARKYEADESPAGVTTAMGFAEGEPSSIKIYCTVGIHPENAAELSDDVVSELRTLAHDDKAVAIGEIGLDYHSLEEDIDRTEHPDWIANPPKEVQKACFESMLRLAHELEMPINIHSREAASDTYEMIVAEEGYKYGGIVHCYSYSRELAERYVKLGMCIGIGGVLTFKNSRKLREVVEAVPLENLVLETDCPYMAPTPHRGERNDPSYLRYVVEKLAELKGISQEEVIRVTTENAERVYRIFEN